ncbi:hypothetical protein CF327_g2044 [Tilletia walkeri]|nr:hypothetical protein CF327_g2044 [Tilletia walkeri]
MSAYNLPIPTITLTPPSEPHRPSERVPHQTLGRRLLYVPIPTADIGWEPAGLFWAGRYAYPTVGIYGGGDDNHRIGSYRGGPEGYRFETYWNEDERASNLAKQKERMRCFAEPSPQSAQAACSSSPEPALAPAPVPAAAMVDNKKDAELKVVDTVQYDDDALDVYESAFEDDSDAESDTYSDAYTDSDFGHLSNGRSDLDSCSSFSRRSSNSSISTVQSEAGSEMGGAFSNFAGKKFESQPFSIVDELQKLALKEHLANSPSPNIARGRSRSPKTVAPSYAFTSSRPKQTSTPPKMARSNSNKSSSSKSSTSAFSTQRRRASAAAVSRPQVLRSQWTDAKSLAALMPNALDCAEWLDSASGWEYERRCEAEA